VNERSNHYIVWSVTQHFLIFDQISINFINFCFCHTVLILCIEDCVAGLELLVEAHISADIYLGTATESLTKKLQYIIDIS